MRLASSRVGLSVVIRVVLIAAITGLSLFSLGCPIMMAIVDTNQRARMDKIKEDLYRYTKNYVLFLDGYNMHLYEEHGIDPLEESRYYVGCATRDLLKKARFSITSGHKFKQLEAWGNALFNCTEVFQDKYLGHVRAFHEALPLDIDTRYTKPLSPKDFGVRLQTLESNMIIFSQIFPKLEEMYNTHFDEFHNR